MYDQVARSPGLFGGAKAFLAARWGYGGATLPPSFLQLVYERKRCHLVGGSVMSAASVDRHAQTYREVLLLADNPAPLFLDVLDRAHYEDGMLLQSLTLDPYQTVISQTTGDDSLLPAAALSASR